jgi:signal transduction histidine kinase
MHIEEVNRIDFREVTTLDPHLPGGAFMDEKMHVGPETLGSLFSAMLAHDIRTPLASVKLILALIERYHLDRNDPVRGYLNSAQASIDQVLRLAEDLLSLSSDASAQTIPDWDLVPVAELVHECFVQASLPAHEKRIYLHLEIEKDLPPILGNQPQISRVLSNLLSNAFKFTPENGAVCLIAKSLTGSGQVALQVRDTGSGIPENRMSEIFDAYHYRDQAEGGGYGLGLAISKQIVEAHGGTISVETKIGVGTTFSVILKAVQGPADPPSPPRHSGSSGRLTPPMGISFDPHSFEA